MKVSNRHNQSIMIRFHIFPQDLWERCKSSDLKKLSSELFASLEFLGQFLRSFDCIFPRVPQKNVEHWPTVFFFPLQHRNR